MRLDGIHHITAITADAQSNLDFYAGVLGLRFVKKTVNFDAPQAYHLYYGDDQGDPGTILTFFEFRGIERGRAGAGMIDRIGWRCPSGASTFWAERLERAGRPVEASTGGLDFEDPEGLKLHIVEDEAAPAELASSYGAVSSEHALRGFAGVRALIADPRPSSELLGEIGAQRHGEGYAFGFGDRPVYSMRASAQDGLQGAGTVHHIAWACEAEEQPAWREALASKGIDVTPIIDRTYFRSIYFREPGGVLFEIATKGPGFAVDEAPDELGTALKLPPQHEPLRPALERELTPIQAPVR